MATAPDTDVAAAIVAAALGYTEGTNLFRGKMRAVGGGIPTKAVFVLATGGPAPETYANSSTKFFFSAVQIMIRSDERDFQSGQADARAIRNALHHVDLAGYITVNAQESEPLYLGEADEGYHLWSVNLELWHEE